MLDTRLEKEAMDPGLHFARGQILVDAGRVAAAIQSWEASIAKLAKGPPGFAAFLQGEIARARRELAKKK